MGTATAWRYARQTITLLAARAPKLPAALAAAKKAGHAFAVIDATLIPIDRVAADRPFCSGKHRRHGMNLQVISSPAGEILWASGPLPGATHDLTAARIWGTILELEAARLIVLADKGHTGAGEHVLTPYRGRNKPASQKAANSAHAKPRAPGEGPRLFSLCQAARMPDLACSRALTIRSVLTAFRASNSYGVPLTSRVYGLVPSFPLPPSLISASATGMLPSRNSGLGCLPMPKWNSNTRRVVTASDMLAASLISPVLS